MKRSKKRLLVLVSVLILTAVVMVLVWWFFIREEKTELVRKPLNEVLAEAPDALKNKYDNLILPDSISLDSPTTLHSIDVNCISGIDEETAVKTVIKLSDMTNKYHITEDDVKVIKYPSGNVDATYIMETSDDPEEFACFFQGGDCVQLISPYYLQKVAGFTKREKYYEVGKDDLSKVVYTVDGKEYSAQQAVDFADTVIEKYKDFYKHDKLVPIFVIAGKNWENDDYSYMVQYAYYFDGIEMNAAGDTHSDKKFQPVYIEVAISSPDKLSSLLDLGTTYNMTFNDNEDSYVTLESALDNASYLLAEYFTHEITDIDIVYATVFETGDTMCEYHPMWRMTTAKDCSTENQMPARYCIYVDMITGEVMLFNDGTGEFISKENIADYIGKDTLGGDSANG